MAAKLTEIFVKVESLPKEAAQMRCATEPKVGEWFMIRRFSSRRRSSYGPWEWVKLNEASDMGDYHLLRVSRPEIL